MSEVILYHAPPSFYSQIARIVLAEKGVPWTSRIVTMDIYEPWYMRLHPGGTISTMVHDGQTVPDSFAISRYVDANFDGPPLIPASDPARAETERWIRKLGDIPVRELSYGSGKVTWLGALMNRIRLAKLKRFERKNPDMADIYRAKQQDIEGFSRNAMDPAHVERLRAQVNRDFDEMEAILAKQPWLSGEDYTMADAFWTVAIARFIFIGLDPLAGRPALAAWYGRAKERPSFTGADVWESFRFFSVAPILLRILAPRLAAAALVIAAIVAAVWWLA